MRRSLWVVLLALLALVANSSAAVIWELLPATNNENVGLIVTVTDIGNNQIKFDLQIDPNKSTGDITGLYFNIAGGVTGVTTAMFTGSDLATACVWPGGNLAQGNPVPWCGSNDNNLNGVPNIPAGSFEIGLAFGSQGNNSITSTTVIFSYAASNRTFSESAFAPMAGRIKSITPGGGSAKLIDLVPFVPDTGENIPEPSTWLMMGAGLGLVALAKMRRTRRS
jgi:hypothetical protein